MAQRRRRDNVALQDAIQWYLTTTRSGIIRQMQQKGFWNSGKTASEINIQIKGSSGELIFPDYFSTMVEGIGRKPGKFPPIQAIIGWVVSKNNGLNPYAVARKMAEEGNAVYRRERPGVDVKAEMLEHKKEFNRRIKEAFIKVVKNKVKQVKKDTQ